MISIADLKQALKEIKLTDEAKLQIDEVVAEADEKGQIDQSTVLKLVRVLEVEMEKDENFADAAEKIVEELQKVEAETATAVEELIGEENDEE